jgi:NAD(P)-dependent dehydrogenase (short-subunit alcohol dehydrogenase family)
MSANRLSGRVCVVTGAGNGIGAATATLFAEHGAEAVVCADLDAEAAEATAEGLRRSGYAATGLAIDISKQDACERLARHAVEAYGGVHVLHNNAGMGVLGSVDEISVDDWDRTMGINLRGTFLVTKAFLPVMMSQDSNASIINTCSTFATVASPRLAAYHASKGGIRALTRQMARDYSPKIRVNSVSPGVVDTNAARGVVAHLPDPAEAWAALAATNHYFRRAAEPVEVAYGVLFLASDESSFVTGHDLVMSGGQGEVAY